MNMGGELINLADVQMLTGAEARASLIEWVETGAMPACLLRCYVVPGAQFGAYLDAGQPPDAATELDLVLPPHSIADLIARLEQAAFDLELLLGGERGETS